MEFVNPAHERCHALVGSYLTQAFGELTQPADETPTYSVFLGRRPIHVSVSPLGDADAYVVVYTWLNPDLEVTDDIAIRVLELNTEYRFGAFGLDDDGDVTYEHTLSADAITKRLLADVVRLMAGTRDEVDDELCRRG